MATILLLMIYLSFISLGLPDAVLGAGWPTMYPELEVPVSYAGAVTIIGGVGTTLSSLLCQRFIARFGTGKVTAFSTAMTAAALLGYSLSGSFWMLLVWAVPLGLGAGCVDAALNNYVAIHYDSRHMSWLHCMWGIGTTVGPYVMGTVLSMGLTWRAGYRSISLMQAVLSGALVLTLPLWARVRGRSGAVEPETRAIPLGEVIAIPRVKAAALCFFFYCALEQSAGLWASSYLHLHRGIPAEVAAGYAGLFFFGITVGRGANGFLTLRFSDRQLVTMGLAIILAGIGCIVLPLGQTVALAGFVLIGVGCAPTYPCLIHATPGHFGADRSQAVIGVEMTGAFLGSALMPPTFGVLAQHLDIALLPAWLLVLLAGLFTAHWVLERE